ncbi:MAG: hypothetical protein LBT38_03390 [Deltaproteobacteria bacterium]|jgi:hypothetical protein|nr:hypothetical protein [Deltaproteobacteria bacterium]
MSLDVTKSEEPIPSDSVAADPTENPTINVDPVAPTPDNASPLESPKFVSQAVRDLANSPDPLDEVDKDMSDNPPQTPIKPSPAKSLGWFLLYALSLFVVVFWAVISFIHDVPYHWPAIILAVATLIVAIPTYHFFSLKTRTGLATIGLSLALTLTSIYDPQTTIFPGVSFPVLWSAVLILAWVLLFWIAWSSFGRDKPGIAILLTCALIYPLLGSGLSLFHSVSSFFSGAESQNLTLNALNHSPFWITERLPSFLWPQAIMALLIPLIGAIVAFKTQLSVIFKKKIVSFAPSFFGLALLILLAPGFLAFTPLSENSALANSLRAVYPDAKFWLDSRPQAKKAATPAKPLAAKPKTGTAQTLVAANLAKPEETKAPLASPTATEIAPPATPTATETTPIETAPSEPASAETAGPVDQTATPSEAAPTVATEPQPQESSPVTAPVSPDPSPESGEPVADAPEITPQKTTEESKSEEQAPAADNNTSAETDPGSTVLLVSPDPTAQNAQDNQEDVDALARSEFYQRIVDENEILERENNDLSRRLALLQNENEILRERLEFSDQLLKNLTNR